MAASTPKPKIKPEDLPMKSDFIPPTAQCMKGGSIREAFEQPVELPRQLALPEAFNLDDTRTGIPMDVFGNDMYNDCVIATRANHTLRIAYEPTQSITAEEVIAAYEIEVTEANGGTYKDNGLALSNSLDRWKQVGWTAAGRGGRRITKVIPINFHDRDQLCTALVSRSGVQIAIDLPHVYSEIGQFGAGRRWSDIEAPRDFNHVLLLVGYNALDVCAITWGTYQSISWEFTQKFCTSAFAVIPNAFTFE